MRFGSVCSGIEAASVAWNPIGFEAAWLAEIEPFPCALLAHHYPDVPNLGDMTTIADRVAAGEVEAPDLFCGGTPCQAFSVAGLRNSLDDARGNLSLVFCEIANAVDDARLVRGLEPAIVFWENVPGVLSTKDNAFGCFLAGLAGEDNPLEPAGGKWTNAGYVLGPKRAVAWRVLDAQYFGVAQRRRRVFVVASARAGFDPAEVLFEFDGVRRDIAPSREAGEGSPGGVESGAVGCGTDCFNGSITGEVAATLGTRGSSQNASGPTAMVPAISQCLTARTGQRYDPETETETETETIVPVLPFDTTQITSPANGNNPKYGDPCHLLAAQAHVPAVAYGIRTANTSSNGWGIQEEATHTLDGAMGVAVAFQESEYGTAEYDTAGTQRAGRAGHTNNIRFGMQVRRLTPTECERLQGFPDGYTLVPNRGKPAADGPRYKALGNSWAVPVVRWIGERIKAAL